MAQLPLALTSGDPSSIATELTLKIYEQRHHKGVPPFVYIGDFDHVQHYIDEEFLGVELKKVESATEAAEIFDHYLPIMHQPLAEKAVLGKPSSNNAAAIIKSIETAHQLVKEGQARAIVTNPIAKSVLYDAGFKYPGHTEFLEHLANQNGGDYKSVMMIASSQLKVVPITVHIALKDVMEKLTTDLICGIADIVDQDMKKYFDLDTPRLAFCGLNPHAGEDGSMGMEDIEVIKPAMDVLISKGINAIGPLPADTMFHERARANYDVALGMYHDQVLIPVKTLDFDKGVNVTLGLPFIRTSPDHGTAFDIAGKRIANPSSLIQAMKMAHKMANQKLMNG